jgi:Protein of unknown function (DUF2934)
MTPDRHAEIANQAYSLWKLEGRPTGRDIEHWLHAEVEFETTQRAQTIKETAPKPQRPATKRGPRSPHGKAGG